MSEFHNDLPLVSQAKELIAASPCVIAALSNLAALLFSTLPDLNWAGFYLMHQGELVVGPFCGEPACIRIPLSKGVCGAAVRENRIQRVADVHAFPGHIACDSRSRSEIVLPIRREGRVIGVLDIDSPIPDRFSEEDERVLQSVIDVLESSSVWETGAYSLN
ncbi:MAG: GAF domain-containing protein [Clostridiales bacterium]|nr:GAF domain-containing protein [Clostridiales bacterium]